MNWKEITSLQELEAAIVESGKKPVLFFKHSTRCSISFSALSRLERKWVDSEMNKIIPYLIDLIRYRNVSDAIVIHTGIEHESPQAIIIYKGEVLYQASHNGILYEDILERTMAV